MNLRRDTFPRLALPCLLITGLAAPRASGQPAPPASGPTTRAAAIARVCVTFDVGDAASIFTPQEKNDWAAELAARASELCSANFAHLYDFQAMSRPDQNSPQVRVFVRRDAGWSLCATVSRKPGPNADPGEWPVSIVGAGEFLPGKVELSQKLRTSLLPTLFAQHGQGLKAALRERAPIGHGGAIRPQPLMQIRDALAALGIDAMRLRNLRDVSLRIEGQCGQDGMPMVLFSETRDFGTTPDLNSFKVRSVEREHKAVDLLAEDLPCLNNFKVGRIFLRDEPETYEPDTAVIPPQ